MHRAPPQLSCKQGCIGRNKDCQTQCRLS